MAALPARVLFGAAYYHEYTPAYDPELRPDERLKTDLDLMAEANFNVIRVGESVWSTWEPENGTFDLDWLEPVLDGAGARDISVVLGTLVIQGLTLKALLRALNLQDDDPVGHELASARARALRAGLASFEHDRSPIADAVREEFTAHLAPSDANRDGDGRQAAHGDIHLGALQAARQAVIDMRTNDEIGDDAFHQMEEELDWLEMAGGGKGEPEAE